MRKVLDKIWSLGSVPFVLLCQGLIFSVVFRVFASGGIYLNSFARVALAIALTLLGMFLLRKVPKRSLICSSAAACVIALAASLLALSAANNHSLSILYDVLRLFIITPNNIVLPVTSVFMADPSPILAIVFAVIEILFPMVYAFSGFVRNGSE